MKREFKDLDAGEKFYAALVDDVTEPEEFMKLDSSVHFACATIRGNDIVNAVSLRDGVCVWFNDNTDVTSTKNNIDIVDIR